MASAPQSGGRETTPIELPQRLVRRLSGTVKGTDGTVGPGGTGGPSGADAPGSTEAADWLAALPGLVRRQLESWELTLERVQTPGGRRSLLVLVTQSDGTPAALKFAAPDGRGGAGLEPAALTHWDGWGAVRLLRADAESGALLLERLHGEVPLRSLPEAKALLEAAGTVRRLWVPPPADPHPFPTLAERTGETAEAILALADGPWAAEARPLVDEALELRSALLADSPELLLLHGDFRQGKVLSADRAPWLAIGPDPVVGERAYDLARLVRDRVEDLAAASGAAAAARRRVGKLADSLEVDRERLRGWTVFRAVETGVRELAAGNRDSGELLMEFAGWL
ncbi:aminoglycoside phosphotransferase family protein [Streptomyces sp. H27-D2]|uniref:aminoglycoside phosphotransferase family protein n=1 Tax=Streptomyces sp. H27-D2 TaxID=3046304 RepID=UPI002DBC9C98|nr:aminoglycoside phosphotransferase family protein [Streptomyces sp. H27-D2]MEC4020670.1 aminoglycoside phosphotransferase family protein [Streptomyces sp. H27-D2]